MVIENLGEELLALVLDIVNVLRRLKNRINYFVVRVLLVYK